MEPDFWQQRWRENLIGFHQEETNRYLHLYWSRLNAPAGSRIFVPLCGKSLDMRWLTHEGYTVLGVEISPLAVESFFQENALKPVVREAGPFSVYSTQGIEIYCGDFFNLQPEHLSGVTGVFDRASLIALPPAMRERYALHLQHILPADVAILLVTLEYPQDEMDGPPFSVHEGDVREYYARRFTIEVLSDTNILAKEPRFAERGLSSLHEKAYLMTPKS